VSTVAIIPARGGSKGIPRKNLVPVAGKPLLAWSILQALAADTIESVWVSSDDEEILDIAIRYGASPILRPSELSSDDATSESAWIHSIDFIEARGQSVSCVVGMQPTSPLRSPEDLDKAVRLFKGGDFDSIFSAVEVEDFFVWRSEAENGTQPINYDFKTRKRRQNIEKRYLENGSFYIFSPKLLRAQNNRLGGKIGMSLMEKYKMFQIDNVEDVPLCGVLLNGFGLDKF
jgi:CMP-N,N'-diacetyllegionaminic acid synthase